MASNEDYVRNLIQYIEQQGMAPDLTARSGEESWKVYKMLVCSQSQWFKNAIVGGRFQEGTTNIITLQDDDEFQVAMELMINYLNTSRYPRTTDGLMHIRLAVLADKYQCSSLLELAKANLATSFRLSISNDYVADWINIATVCYQYLSADIPDHLAIREVILAPLWESRSNISLPTLLNSHLAQTFLRDHGAVATDILLRGRDGPMYTATEWVTTCPNEQCKFVHVGTECCRDFPYDELWDCTKNGHGDAPCGGCGRYGSPDSNLELACPKCGQVMEQQELEESCEKCVSGRHNGNAER